MKNFVKILLVVSIFGYGTVAIAQEKQDPAAKQAAPAAKPAGDAKGAPQQAPKPLTPEERAEKRAEQLKKRLDLSTEQVAKVKAIIMKSDTEMQNAMKTAGADKEARMAARDKVRENEKAEMIKVLNPEQQTKYKAMENPPKRPTEGGKDGKPAPAPAPVKKEEAK